MEVNFYPARSTGDILTVILSPPPLHKAHPDRAHLCEFVHGLEAVVDRLSQELGKLLVVEDLETAAGRDLAHRGRMEGVRVVALPTVHKDSTFAQTLRKHLSPDVKQVDPFPNVVTDVLNGRVSVHVREKPETEPVCGGGGVHEPVNNNVGAGGVEGLTDSLVELIVGN